MRGVLNKIGVTGGSVEDRIANAERDPTYLLAPVEIAATWKLANIRRFHACLGNCRAVPSTRCRRSSARHSR